MKSHIYAAIQKITDTPHAKRDRIPQHISIAQFQFEMVLQTAHLALLLHLQTTHEQQRFAIAFTGRFERLQSTHDIQYIPALHFPIQPHLGSDAFPIHRFQRDLREILLQLFQILFFHRQSRRPAVSPILHQQIGTAIQRLGDMKFRNTAARSADQAVMVGTHNGWQIIFLT